MVKKQKRSAINSKGTKRTGGPAKEYHVEEKNGSFWVMTPDGRAIVVPHKTRQQAQMIANVFNHTQRDPRTVVTTQRNKLTLRQTDTIIAALRLWQRAPQYPDKEIDSLIETQLNA